MIGIIGSYAAKKQGVDLGHLGDLDIVATYANAKAFMVEAGAVDIRPHAGNKLIGKAHTMIEAELVFPNTLRADLLQLIIDDPKSIKVTDNIFAASLDVYYMLKMTHRFKKNHYHFLKTMADIHALRKAGAIIRPEHTEFYQKRLKETLDYSHPNLMQSKKGFFTDSVPYLYDHDSLHLAVARLYKPAYNFYKPDESEVFCSQALFDQQDIAVRLLGVYEEACVLALERSQIPYPTTDPKVSFDKALEKVCTSITSGWFREFAWENYNNIQKLYAAEVKAGRQYTSLFHRGLATGKVKLHERT